MNLSANGQVLLNVDNSDIKNGSFEIPNGVTSIGANAFINCTSLQEVSIPPGVTSINDHAFAECRSLKKISIPAGVTSIGVSVFLNCTSLQEVSIPPGVTSIAFGVFIGCENLEQICIPGSVNSIGFRAIPSHCKILIDSNDVSDRNRIIELLPKYLSDKVVIYSMEELNKIWEKQLNRINNTPETNSLYRWCTHDGEKEGLNLPNDILGCINDFYENPYYLKAKTLMKQVPLPTKLADKKRYEDEIKRIVDNSIQKAVEFNNEPDSNNYSFLLNAFTATVVVGALALIVASFVAILVMASLPLSISLLAAGAGCGVVAAGTFFYRSCTTPKDEPDSTEKMPAPG